jgi:predicted ArsR family transcriptional regulator
LEILGTRQKELLKQLLKNKTGMTVDQLSGQLSITRSAVRQHLASLENDGLVEKGITRASGGRPEQLYVLTSKGKECFPRHYSWFAQLLVESVQQESGPEELSKRLTAMGTKVAQQLRTQYPDLKTREEKVQKLAEVMEQFGYSTMNETSKGAVIEADNCVFHHLALQNPAICEFDLALLSTFTDSKVDHQECMAKNGNVCRFKFNANTKEH